MKRTRYQRGYLYKKGSVWMLRYYDIQELPDGTIKRVQKAQKLVEAVGEYRSKSAARQLAEEILARINASRKNPTSVMSLDRFVESHYLPFVETHNRLSTYHGYRNLWKRYLKKHGQIPVRDFTTGDAERVLESVAQENELRITTLQHVKAFLSGAFRYAKRQGVIRSGNPVRDAVLPKAKPATDTYAYSLEEIIRTLDIVPESAAAIVAVASFTGARKGELRGFRWEDYDGRQLRVSQAYWRSHLQEPKTRRSKAPIPVIAQLKERLDLYRELLGSPTTGLIFQGPTGKPINLDRLAGNVIRPAMEKVGLKWHGWHAFRRGLATNLHRLGVPAEVIQRILRQANVAVTQACYIKTADADAFAAMRALENAPNMHLGSPKRLQVM